MRSFSVLIIEDNADEAFLLQALLEQTRSDTFRVTWADTLKAGLDRLTVKQPDVVLLDLSLPDSHGLVTLARVREHAPGVPVVVLSGVEDELTRVQAVRQGAQDYLVKGQMDPFSMPRTLVYAVERQRTRAELAGVAQLGRELIGSLDSQAVAERVVTIVTGVLRASCAVLLRLEPDGLTLRCVAVAGAVSVQHWLGQVLPRGYGAAGRAVVERRPIASENLLMDPAVLIPEWLRERIRDEGHVGGAAVPLIAHGTVLGALAIADAGTRSFGEEDLRLLATLGDQAALALQTARLYEQTERRRLEAEELSREAERRRREAEVVAELARSISSSLDLDTVLRRVTTAARDLCDSDVARIALRDPQSNALVHRVLVGDPEAWAADDRHANALTTLSVPSMLDDRVEAMLSVGTRRTHFADRDEAILRRLADHAAIAIRNAELFAREQAARAEAETSTRALEESETRYRLAARATRDAIWDWDPATDQMRWNEGGASLFGYTGSDVGADAAWRYERIHPDDRERVTTGLRRTIENAATIWSDEYRFRRSDGAYATVMDRGYVVRSPEGTPVRMIGAVADVTDRRELEGQLRQAQKMEAVGSLAGGIAHDFNNLLTVITGRSLLLLDSMPAEASLRRHIELIQRTAERAAALTRQLLAFSRKQVLQPKVLQVNEVITNFTAMLRRMIGEDVKLSFLPAQDLWCTKVDPGQIEQVIANLAVNARDAMPQGGHLTIETANVELDETYAAHHVEVRPGPYVMIAVSDSGEGMTPETRTRIFEPFFTTKPVGRGTGLGLATVYGIVKQSGGDIWVYSEIGLGTTFKIYLPRVDTPAEALIPEAPLRPSPRGTETILLVEDEPEVRELAREVLESHGYTVLATATGAEALAVTAQHERIALLMTDVVLPDEGGPRLAERLLAQRSGLKVCYMSGYTRDATLAHGILHEGTAFLQKPFTPDALTRKVRDVLDR